MNGTTTFTFSPILIFLLVGGLIVLAMTMSRRKQESQRAGFGWWLGLGLLLLVASGFLAFSRMKGGAIKEERHTGRYAFSQAIAEMKEGIANGAQAMQEGLDEANKSLEEVKKAMTSVKSGSKTSNRKSGNDSVAVGSFPAPPALPLSTLEWTVEVKGQDRHQSKDEVARSLRKKAVQSVNKWVMERMPIKYIWFSSVDETWLEQHGVLPMPIEYETEDVPRLNTNQKDPLHGGTLKVVLPPEGQQSLIEIGYKQLEKILLDDKFEAQGILFFCLLGITAVAAFIGFARMMIARAG